MASTYSLDPQRSVVRLVYSGAGGSSHGSGLLVSPQTILTARHVVDPHGVTQQAGRVPDARAVAIEGTTFRLATVVVDELRFPEDPAIDLALAIVWPPKSAQTEDCASLAEPGAPSVTVGDQIQVFGCSRMDGSVEFDDLRLQGIHENAGVWICNKAIPKGFSGGPAFADGMAVGTAYARDHEQGQSFVYTGNAWASLVSKQAIGPVKWVSGGFSELRRFPLGPAMPPSETVMLLGTLIDKCVELFGPAEAKRIVARANKLRLECGPDTGRRATVEVAKLPLPELNLSEFWVGAFEQASVKSPRMLAALLLTLEDAPFESDERAEKADVLSRLECIRN